MWRGYIVMGEWICEAPEEGTKQGDDESTDKEDQRITKCSHAGEGRSTGYNIGRLYVISIARYFCQSCDKKGQNGQIN